MLKLISSFSAGELDPALRERTNLQKYETGAATARNVRVRKTGGVATTPGTKYLAATKLAGRKIITHDLSKMFDGHFLEFGHEYVRIRRSITYLGQVFPTIVTGQDEATPFTEADLVNLRVVDGLRGDVYVFCKGKEPIKLQLFNSGGNVIMIILTGSALFTLMPAPLVMTANTVGGNGYFVEYVVTAVYDGEESLPLALTPGASFQMPIAVSQSNSMTIRLVATSFAKVPKQMRVYRRPQNGQSYGYIGFTTNISVSGGFYVSTFVDIGQEADYTHQYPNKSPGWVKSNITGPEKWLPTTALVYQQRLLMTHDSSIEASRVGFLNNFYRDYPYGSDSALTLEQASGGYLEIYHLMDADGLISFTSHGVFTQSGVMGPSNLGMTRRGPWVIEPSVAPILLPGAVFFVDQSANVVRHLVWSEQGATYLGPDTSVFSDHLFFEKRVVSIAFTDDLIPTLWVVFQDGTYATLTYERDQEMRAWTRHDHADGELFVENVIGTKYFNHAFYGPQVSKPIFTVRDKDGNRWLEIGLPRDNRQEMFAADPEAYMNDSTARLQSMVSFRSLINPSLTGGDVFTLTPVNPGDWEGDLTLTCGTSGLFTTGGRGAVGTKFRFFHPVTRESILLEVLSRTNNNTVVVEPSGEWPSAYASGFRLYDTFSQLTGLSHLNGVSVGILGDGYVMASPNNDRENYPVAVVSGGTLTLNASIPAPAIVHVGRPYTSDLETLNIATIEQKPTNVEPITVNKLYVTTQRSRGVFVGATFPDANKVDGMEMIQVIDGEPMTDGNIVGNRYQEPVSKRYEVTLPGDWQSNGRICVRVVDPVHAEILSIIPDAEANLRRGD